MLKVKLEDIMSEQVVSITEKATIGQAAHLMLRYRINGILIAKDKNKRKIIGVITTTDLLRFLSFAIASPGHRLKTLSQIANFSVGKVGDKHLVKVQKDTRIEKVIAIMHKRNIHTIPVYDKNKLVGIVGRHDILNVAFAD